MNINLKQVKSNIRITQSSGNVGSVNLRVVPKPVNDFYKKTSEKDMFIKLVKSGNRQIDIVQFMNDNTLEFPLVKKKIFIETEKLSDNKKQVEYGAGSTFRKEINYRKKDDSNKTPKFVLSVPNSSKMKDGTYKHRRFKGNPTELNANCKYMILQRKSKNEFHAYPVSNWYKIGPYNDVPIDEEIDLNKPNLDAVKKYVSVCETEDYTELAVFGENDQKDNDLSDDEKREKDRNTNRKRTRFLKKMRYGDKDQHDVESDVGDHENEEVDYMTSDSSMDEEKLDDAERQLIYETNDVNEEGKLSNKLLGKEEPHEDEEDLEENSREAKKKENMHVTDESHEADDEDNDDDDDEEDSEESSYESDEENESKSKNPVKRSFIEAFTEEGRNENDKRPRLKRKEVGQEMQEIIMEQPLQQIDIKNLFKQMVIRGVLQNDSKSKQKFFEVASQLGLNKLTIEGEAFYRL